MDTHIKEFYCQFSEKTPNGHFHKVIPLHENLDLSWTEVQKMVPTMCRGWYELAHLSTGDRIEFLCSFWIEKMPFHPGFSEFISQFFDSLDDIGIFITQKMFDSPYEAHLVYSLKGDNGFFHGEPSASQEEIEVLKRQFPSYALPDDYLAFLRIHNGFSKSTDSGVFPSFRVEEVFNKLQQTLSEQDLTLKTVQGTPIDPKTLIPFYESFNLPCYHCFWAEWYPIQEMGNVYYSGITHTISDCRSSEPSPENLAFPTFTDWLLFYLETLKF